MKRAFLSHSFLDKEFVRAVALDLGRQFCLFDEQVFDTGESFKQSIEKHLDDSSIFVLFASTASLKSIWVDFEIEEAWYRRLEGRLSQTLVFITDTSISHDDLPPWLKRAKVSRVNVAKIVAREIRQHLEEMLRVEQHPYFEGRTEDLGRLQKLMRPIAEPAPRVLAIYGLPSIGRKTFIKKAAQLMLSFNRAITIQIGESDKLQDIAIKAANILEPFATKAGFDNIVSRIRSESKDQLVNRLLSDLRVAVSNKEIPVLIDDGGVFTQEGYFTETAKTIIDAIKGQDDLYTFLVSTRKPVDTLPSLQLKPLEIDDVKRLIGQISASQSLTPPQISELAEYVNGYPPSAYYAIELVKAYGINAVLADKHRLVQFKATIFVKYLASRLLTEHQKSILVMLAQYSPIPMQILVDTQNRSPSELAGDIMQLVDHSLVIPNETGLYSIAGPIVDAVSSEFRAFEVDHKKVYESLKALLSDESQELPRLDLYRLFFKASIRSNAKDGAAFHMTNDLIKLVEDYYHAGEYKPCIAVAKLAINEDAQSFTAHDYLIRSLVQEEEWQAAETEIRNLEKFSQSRDIYFLTGFLNRKKGNFVTAIDNFLKAEKLGRTGAALKREIASCYFHNDQLPEAKRYVHEALSRNSDNRFVLDIAIQIAVREGDEQTARTLLERLSAFDTPSFVKHRLSTIELSFGTLKNALNAAIDSVNLADSENKKPKFGMLAQLINCYTRTGQYSEAENTLSRLSRIYSNQRPDIRAGLECRIEIERKHFPRALSILENIGNKSQIYLAMRRDAIDGILNGVVNDDQRIKYEQELAALNAQLNTYDPNGAWLTLIR
ncbi:toll/interleukin-1 receptor domain-containing protein [Gallionella capsiferriformans]|uniref:TIR domain-containing protein n=1 Tax=Gallionella capsiferriformans (strain ES-2) TaxID=395494 RepID=D9SFG6_GALCS|nr:toll/interleukin-1 receptor domain-containing protein [Gallionella capsiferriformans]ADL55263.1 Domain of unknown function DUF1863 [Gallionella capsiferriformans ES-2]